MAEIKAPFARMPEIIEKRYAIEEYIMN